MKLNGKLTLGENVADNGGLRLGWMALMESLADASRSATADGFTPEQRFFIGWGQMWCENQTRRDRARCARRPNPHSPGRYRVERRGVEHAGVPEGVRLSRRRADGHAAGVPGLVRPAPQSNLALMHQCM